MSLTCLEIAIQKRNRLKTSFENILTFGGLPNTCPSCGIDRDWLAKVLLQKLGLNAFYEACDVIETCPACRKVEYEIIQKEMMSRCH